MSDQDRQGGRKAGADKRAGRAARQAEALRANLRRRKDQAKERGAPPPKPIKNPERKP